MSIVEEGVDFLIENGVSDLEKFNTDDITLSVNSQGELSRSLGQEQMVSFSNIYCQTDSLYMFLFSVFNNLA